MATAQASVSAYLYSSHPRALARRPPSTTSLPITSSFRGSPLLVWKISHQTKHGYNAASIRSEQSTKDGSGLDVWLGRLAMVGFAAGISVEVITGKGLLENFGLTSPLPTVALAVTGLVGVLTAVFIFQSSSKE